MFNKGRYNGSNKDGEGKPLKILISAPDRDLLDSLRRLLEVNGWDADVAHDGVGTINKMRSAEYDAALVDEKIPLIRADDIIRELSAAGVPAILMTESGTQGGCPILKYPFTPEELLSAVRNSAGVSENTEGGPENE